jgi:hypothetical protein
MLKLYQGDDRMLENYLITKEGFIISYKNKEPRVLKGQLDRDGYYRVEIRENKKRKWCYLHRLVAMQYIPNPENKPEVNHINGIKTDNRVENLEWVTRSENAKHAVLNDMCKQPKKVNQYNTNGEFIRQWNSIKEAKKCLNIKNAHISQVCQGQRKTAGGYIWRYDTNKSKLNKEKVREIRENKENLNRVALAKKYGVSCSCIQHIRRGRTWKDVMPGEFGDKL